MKNTLFVVLILGAASFTGCGKKTEDHAHHHEATETSAANPNKALYDSVMDVHNEVMPKLEDIYKMTESLKDKVAKTPSLSAAQKQQIQTAVDSLDKAADGMMVWMRQFKPLDGTADQQEARDYLHQEMIKVTKVKTDILTSLEKGKALQ